jgi:hypothetical protein
MVEEIPLSGREEQTMVEGFPPSSTDIEHSSRSDWATQAQRGN